MTAPAVAVPADEDLLRAQLYGLLGRLLAAPPDAELLTALQVLGGDGGDNSEVGRAYHALGAMARATTATAARAEFQALFIGIGQGDLTPFASYYLTGFLHEKPLAALRGDMAALGIARADDVTEPEDHVAALMDMMSGLITGAFGAPVDLATQHAFFRTHIAPWTPRFFEDLQAAASARFYMPVGTLGGLFMDIEQQAFEMAA